MQATRSQKALANAITSGLQDREIVCLWGNPNGKTSIFYNVMANLSIGLDGRIRSEIRPRHSEDFTVEILQGIDIPMCSDIIDINRIKRMIMQSYGEKPPHGSLMMGRKFIQLLIDLHKARIIPCLAMDEIEVLPRKGYSVIKMLHEIQYDRKKIGVAALLSGSFAKRKMPENFWMHVKEVQVGKISEQEVAEFIQYLAPGFDQKFTRDALRKIAECHTTLEMSRVVRTSIEFWKRVGDDEIIDKEIIKSAWDKIGLSKAKLAA